jgi:hypothetical protein
VRKTGDGNQAAEEGLLHQMILFKRYLELAAKDMSAIYSFSIVYLIKNVNNDDGYKNLSKFKSSN